MGPNGSGKAEISLRSWVAVATTMIDYTDWFIFIWLNLLLQKGQWGVEFFYGDATFRGGATMGVPQHYVVHFLSVIVENSYVRMTGNAIKSCQGLL